MAMRNTIILAIFLMVVMAVNVSADAGDFKCRTIVERGDRVLQVNPQPFNVDGVGVVDFYESKNGLVKVEFNKDNLRVDQTYNFTVQCNNGSVTVTNTQSITPHSVSPLAIGDRLIFLKANAGFILGISVFLLFGLLGVKLWRRTTLPF